MNQNHLNASINIKKLDSATSSKSGQPSSREKSFENDDQEIMTKATDSNHDQEDIFEKTDSKIIHHENLNKSRRQENSEDLNAVCNEINELYLENTDAINEKTFEIEIVIKQPLDSKNDFGFVKEIEIDLLEKLSQEGDDLSYYVPYKDEINRLNELGIPVKNDSDDTMYEFKNQQQETKF